MNISEKLTARKLHDIAVGISRKCESSGNIGIIDVIDEIKRQIMVCCADEDDHVDA